MALLLIAGCTPTTLDLTSVDSLERSLTRFRGPMTPDELARFDEALDYLVGDEELAAISRDPDSAQSVPARFQPLAGLTADGIVAEARFRRIRKVRSVIILLESLREESRAARRELDRFRFVVARVFKRHRQFLEWPVIEIRVENGTDHMISLVHFRAALLSDDSVDPWILEDFDHVAFGGLAPGQSDLWRIEPDQQEWIRLIDPHPEVEFSLEVMRLDGRGGRQLVASDWGGVEAHRLKLYRRTLGKIRKSGTLALDSPPSEEAAPAARQSTAAASRHPS